MAKSAPPGPEADARDDERASAEVLEEILDRYGRKFAEERRARLEGRIAAADLYVRQLTYLEVILDIGGKASKVLKMLERPDLSLVRIAATPMSVLLDEVRRGYWAEQGEPERPPLGDLGEHDDEIATGPPDYYLGAREGVDYRTWCRRRDERSALAAEAQAAWEEKARADAERWRERLAGEEARP